MPLLMHENVVTVSFRYFDYDESTAEEIERDVRMVLDTNFLDEYDGDEIVSVTVERTGNNRLYNNGGYPQ